MSITRIEILVSNENDDEALAAAKKLDTIFNPLGLDVLASGSALKERQSPVTITRKNPNQKIDDTTFISVNDAIDQKVSITEMELLIPTLSPDRQESTLASLEYKFNNQGIDLLVVPKTSQEDLTRITLKSQAPSEGDCTQKIIDSKNKVEAAFSAPRM